ncbi:hypothetical protein DFH06DRAFT_1085908 [Mycena polygramma]|nr:hypothetical protein DFH06DRAFT_1085908 [Mycena polygramma]
MTHDPTPSATVANDSESEDESVISVASTVVESEDNFTRVEELWFEEDNLIVRAEDTLFRVSKGILAARSPVLKAMLFGLPQPNPENMGRLYGCPVLELPHSARSVTNFLKAIFDSDFFLPPPEQSWFRIVVDILRLSHEYDVKYLFRRALFHFETYYPSVLDGDRVYDPVEDDDQPEPGPAHNGWCDLQTLIVASEVGAQWNIPCIIYDCCTLDLAALLSVSLWENLSVEHKRLVLVAHGKQKLGTRLVSKFLLADHPAECVTNAACTVAKLSWLKVLDRRSRKGDDSSPLSFWSMADWEDMRRDFCEVCWNKYQKSHERQRGIFWDRLPESLGLAEWAELKTEKDAVFLSK